MSQGLRFHEVLIGPCNVLEMMFHIHPGGVYGHGLNFLLRQQLLAYLLSLLRHLQTKKI